MPFPSLPRLFNAVLPRTQPFKPAGVSGTPVYGGYVLSPERNPKLIGPEKYRTFSDILTNTTIVAAGMRYFLNVISRPQWNVEPVDQTDEAKKAAEFVERVLLDELKTPWSRVVRRMGTYRFYGFAVQEWTAKKNDDGTVGFEDIESRPQWTIWRWEVDERGQVIGAWQRDPLTGRELGLPRNKIMYLVDDTLTDSPEGLGLLRHCVEPAERLKEYLRQEGYGFLRDLRGVPVGRVPMEELDENVKSGKMTQAERDKAVNSVLDFVRLERKSTDTAILLSSEPYKNLSTDGESYAAQPKWGLELISGAAPGLAEVGSAIVRVQTEIARILGIEQLMMGADSTGSFAMAKEKASGMYLLANSMLRDIQLQAQQDLLNPLWSLNGLDEKLMPRLKAEDVAPKDVEQIARVLSELATAGAPIPPGDEETVNFVRDILGAPHVDMEDIQSMYPPDLLHAQGGYPEPAMGAGEITGEEPPEGEEEAPLAKGLERITIRLED